MQIATGLDSSGGPPPTAMLARPHIIDAPSGKARIGWLIQRQISHIKLQLRPVPLLSVNHMDSPILIITYNRADYLERALWKVFEHHPAQIQQQKLAKSQNNGDTDRSERHTPRMAGTPIIVSQDGKNKEVKAVIETYRQLFEMKLGVPLYRIEHPRSNEVFDTPYKPLAWHYGWALEQTFSGAAYDNKNQKHNRKIPMPPLPQRVIILEEDIEVAQDFFSFMNATADLLDKDSTLLAVSAFNDNGKEEFVADPKRLVRSDFFPGLGWMMSRSVWDGPSLHPNTGLKHDWAPNGYWDDWLREGSKRWGRQIIRPEVSRTFHFGNIHGASEGENNGILNRIDLQENDIHWEKEDLSYLDASRFANDYWNRVSHARLAATVAEAKSHIAHSDVKLVYNSFSDFREMAFGFQIMDDEKAGVPRTGYDGIVEIRYGRGDYFIFFTPPYVNGNDKPEHFGKKAWMEYSKESLMKELEIKEEHDKGL